MLVRRLIILAISFSMILAGVWLLLLQLTVSRIIYGWALMGGGMLLAVGIGWLWVDIVRPMFIPSDESD